MNDLFSTDTLSSSEFRKRYATLKRRTVVSANGHPIGVWDPVTWVDGVADLPAEDFAATATTPAQTTRQAMRDDLLRKINRGQK